MTTKVKPSVLADTAVTSSTYGGSGQIPVFTVDSQGRLTYAANATPSIATSQLTGTVSATQVANNQTYGINVSGNAGTVTNGVYTNGSYSDPSWLTLSKDKVGLGAVANTADADKSVSSANTATYATTQSAGDNSNKIATTAYVQSQISSSAIGWNVTYTSVNISSGGTWSVPSNCIGVYVYCYVYGGNNNGGNGRAQIKNSGGSTLGTVYVNGTNNGVLSGRGDGGSGMTDAAAAFIPLSSTASSIYFDVYDNAVNGTFYIQAYVTK
jgi:hypothetical protein